MRRSSRKYGRGRRAVPRTPPRGRAAPGGSRRPASPTVRSERDRRRPVPARPGRRARRTARVRPVRPSRPSSSRGPSARSGRDGSRRRAGSRGRRECRPARESTESRARSTRSDRGFRPRPSPGCGSASSRRCARYSWPASGRSRRRCEGGTKCPAPRRCAARARRPGSPRPGRLSRRGTRRGGYAPVAGARQWIPTIPAHTQLDAPAPPFHSCDALWSCNDLGALYAWLYPP